MSCFGLKKRLLPSRKIMRGFTSLIKSNLLQKIRPSKIMSVDSGIPQRSRHRKRAHSAAKLSRRVKKLSPVYVDELFNHQPAAGVNLKWKAEEPHRQICGSVASTSNVKEAVTAEWDAGELGEVDLRAEMFIRKFKEEMRLQRQKSIGEYQEMLARGLS